jgi:hypothetical protein
MHALTVVVMRSVLVPLPSFANDRIANTVADLEPAKTFSRGMHAYRWAYHKIVNDLIDVGDHVVDVVGRVRHADPALGAAQLPSDAPIHHAYLNPEAR